jgi:hypothetical protein
MDHRPQIAPDICAPPTFESGYISSFGGKLAREASPGIPPYRPGT